MRRYGISRRSMGTDLGGLLGREGDVDGMAADNRLFMKAEWDRYPTGIPWHDISTRFWGPEERLLVITSLMRKRCDRAGFPPFGCRLRQAKINFPHSSVTRLPHHRN